MVSGVKDAVLQRHTNLKGQTALVTGGSKGIGRAVVEELASLGAKVLTCSRTQADLDEACRYWKDEDLDVQGFAADLSTNEGLDEIAKKAGEVFGGKLNILVNNVGTNVRTSTADYSLSDYKKVMSTNLDSVFLLTQKCYPLLKAGQKSSVVMIGSIAGGPLSINSGCPYAMTKAAIDQMTRVMTCEWAKDGIRLNSVKPAYIVTPLTQHMLKDPKRMTMINSNTPMRRVGSAEEVAGLVAFLCSSAAAYITGQCISVDGGFSCSGMWPFEDVVSMSS